MKYFYAIIFICLLAFSCKEQEGESIYPRYIAGSALVADSIKAGSVVYWDDQITVAIEYPSNDVKISGRSDSIVIMKNGVKYVIDSLGRISKGNLQMKNNSNFAILITRRKENPKEVAKFKRQLFRVKKGVK